MNAMTIFLIVVAFVLYLAVGLFIAGLNNDGDVGFYLFFWPLVLAFIVVFGGLGKLFNLGKYVRKRWDNRK